MGESKTRFRPGNMTVLCIGAHPDDCEFQCSGTAAGLAKRGDRVVYLSVTDGRSGHHKQPPETIAKRRREEASTAASIIGAESHILGAPDGALEPSLDWRLKLIEFVRTVKPDVIVTNRPNDYHPDHRYTSLLVQDAAYMFMVPHVASNTPALEYNPVILYWVDPFTYPREIRPDMAISIDEVFDTKLRMLAAHESQMFEWLPWIERYDNPPPQDHAERMSWLPAYYRARYQPSTADRFRERLISRYGIERGSRVEEAEVYEVCEYGTRPSADELESIFDGI